jgi:hypothetical protein
MAVIGENNADSWYDSSRPFTFKFKSTNANAIGIVYILQRRNEDTNSWETVTEHLKQPLEWGYSNVYLIDPSQICTDYVYFAPVQYMATTNIQFMKYHATRWRMYATEQILDTTTNSVDYNNNSNDWYMVNQWWTIDNATTHEETFRKAEKDYTQNYNLNASNWSGQHTCKMLSDMPKVTEVCYEDNHVMSWASRIKATSLECDIYREDGTVHTNVVISDTAINPGVHQFGIGVPQIQYWMTLNGVIGTYWSSTNDWTKLVWRWCLNGTKMSADYTFNIKRCGCTDEHVRIWWRSSRNGMDCFTLKGTYAEKIVGAYERFQKPLGHKRSVTERTNETGYQNNNTFNQQSSGVSKVNIRASKKLTVFSHWVNKEHLEWLSQVLTSTNVYVEDRSSSVTNSFKLTPVIVTNGEIQTKPLNSSLGKIKLNLEYANPRTTNRI